MIPVGSAKTVSRERKQSNGSKIVNEQVTFYLVSHRDLNSHIYTRIVLILVIHVILKTLFQGV